MNKENEFIKKNIELSTEFSRYIFEHPEIEEKIPTNSEIIFLPEYDNELKDFNLKLGKKLEFDGKNVVYIEIQQLRPKKISRIENVKVA